jgi:hypothetical protein
MQIKGYKYFLTDLYSKNGTFVDGKDLSPGIETEVKEGVPIVIGMTILGLGAVCELCLKPFLDSAGFNSEMSEGEEDIELSRVMTIRKNLEFIYNVNNSLMESKDLKEISKKLLNRVKGSSKFLKVSYYGKDDRFYRIYSLSFKNAFKAYVG